MGAKRIDTNNVNWSGGNDWLKNLGSWVNKTFPPKPATQHDIVPGPYPYYPYPVRPITNQGPVAVAPPPAQTKTWKAADPRAHTTYGHSLSSNNHASTPTISDIWSPGGGEYWGSGSAKSSSSSSSGSSSPGASYSRGGYGGGGGYSPPPPPMPAFHAKAPTFDRYGGREWNPDDPANVTPIDMGERPAPYARDVAKYKKLLGEEV